MLSAALAGFLLGGSLIIAIGAQNAYILRTGLLRHHVFWLCLFCAVSDALLIMLGIAGLGAVVQANPRLLSALALFGGGFLLAYAVIAARRVFNPSVLVAANVGQPSLKRAIATVAGFTWLNPHVYLDTVVLVGAFSTRFEGNLRLAFASGAVTASFFWFFSLGYGARLLKPVFNNPRAWQVLDALIALIMAGLGISLLREAFG